MADARSLQNAALKRRSKTPLTAAFGDLFGHVLGSEQSHGPTRLTAVGTADWMLGCPRAGEP